ncbi:MAG: FG-GAP-like repeat-containing protein [Kiritimatiellaeota bacterium]|nr:FG-GAP-like repeat-containing protein [Kiritimatiellota bacterium]
MKTPSFLSGNKYLLSLSRTMIAAFVLFAALGTTAVTAFEKLAPDPTNLTFTIGYGGTNTIVCTRNFVLTVPADVSATAYLLGTNRSWLSVADSEGEVSGTIAAGTNKTIIVTLLPEGLAIGSYSGIVTSGVAWLDVTVSLDITVGELGLDGLVVKNKIYDGNVAATVSSFGTLRGVVGTEDVTLVTSNASAEFRHGAGASSEPKLVYVSGLALAGAQAGNYSINNIRTMAYIVLPSVTADFDNDGKADMAIILTNGYWKIWWSTADYTPYISAAPLYVAGGVPVAADFDNDHKADMAMVAPDGYWTIWWSTADYTPCRSAVPLYVAGGTPVAADFDKDGRADPCMVGPDGTWTIWWSTDNYAPHSSALPLYVAGGVPVAADFDKDGKADMAMVGLDGYWKIWWSTADYAPFSSMAPLYVEGGMPVAADFDKDGKADPTVVGPDGVWKILWSSADYTPVQTIPLIP